MKKTVWHKKEYHNNQKDKLDRKVKRVLHYCIKNKKETPRFKEYFEFNYEDLIAKLYSSFGKGMTFDNYGEWHIDHLVAKKHFYYTSIYDEEYKLCWSLKNLRPLWAKDNLKKGVKWCLCIWNTDQKI